MKMQRVVRCGLAVSAILALVVIGVSGPSCAQDKTIAVSPSSEPTIQGAPEPLPVPHAVQATSATLSVAGTTLRPRASSTTYGYGGNGTTYAVAGTGYFNAQVYLPQGAVITSFRMYYYDADATYNCQGWISCYGVNGQILTDISSVASTGSAGYGFVDSAPINHTVDNTLYNYALVWGPSVIGTDMRLAGFSIIYTPPATPARSSVIPLY